MDAENVFFTSPFEENSERLRVMSAGMADLQQWLRLLIAQGFAGQLEAAETWEHFAARMVDAKLGGIAKRIRLLQAQLGEPDWPEKLLEEVADLYLLSQAFQRRQQLGTLSHYDLAAVMGVHQRKEEVLNDGHHLKGHWLVAGQSFGLEEKINIRRTWLLSDNGTNTALLLDFVWGNNGFQEQWEPGSTWNAELVFYPSAFPQRALAKSRQASEGMPASPSGFLSIEVLLERFAAALAANPWIEVFPALLEGVTPHHISSGWFLSDQQGKIIRLQTNELNGWQLLSLSAGHSIGVFGEWNGISFKPLSVFASNRFVLLQGEGVIRN